MPSDRRHPLDKNVSADWHPVEGLQQRKVGMTWSDRLWHWLISLCKLAIAGFGLIVMTVVHSGKLGGIVVGVGIVMFCLGFPSQAHCRRGGLTPFTLQAAQPAGGDAGTIVPHSGQRSGVARRS